MIEKQYSHVAIGHCSTCRDLDAALNWELYDYPLPDNM